MAFATFALLASLGCDAGTRAERAWEAGEVEDAVALWEQAEALDPAARVRFARGLVQVGRLEEAQAQLDAVPGQELGAEGWLVTGLIGIHGGDHVTALRAFEAGLAVEALPELLVNRCAVRILLLDEPVEACQAAVSAAETDVRAQLGLAEATAQEGLNDVAVQALQSAAALPGAEDHQAWQARIWAMLGQHMQACALGQDSPSLGIARSCLAAGQTMIAKPMLIGLAEADGRAAALLLRLTIDEAAGNTHDPVLRETAHRWKRAVEGSGLEPDDEVHTDLGRLAALDGEDELAREHWLEAVRLAPGVAAPRLNLAQQYLDVGDVAAAEAILRSEEAEGVEMLALGVRAAEIVLEHGDLEGLGTLLANLSEGCRYHEQKACGLKVAWLDARLDAKQGEVDAMLAKLELVLTEGGPGYRARIDRQPDFAPYLDRMDLQALLSD